MSKKYSSNPLPYHIITAAANGDMDALSKVMRHYGSYIYALSKTCHRDEHGTPYCFIDEELRRELEMLLITKTIGFHFKSA